MSEPTRLKISARYMSLELVPVQRRDGTRYKSAAVPNLWALPGGGQASTSELGDLCRRRGWYMQDPHLAERRRLRGSFVEEGWTRSSMVRIQAAGEAYKGGVYQVRS